ncbi:MAG: hypothetical protein ISS47_07905 [Candidatus Omnitrophica bacterium]|nr:hypothetical protein [Candidatus Omnitrophota bacterium]
MSIPILFLDCDQNLSDTLIKQGYDIESGEIGYATGIRRLPAALYEKSVIIYNPTSFKKCVTGYYVDKTTINNITPEYDINVLTAHINDGAAMLIFLNKLADDVAIQRRAYEWIPHFPALGFTKDKRILKMSKEKLKHYDNDAEYCAPLISVQDLKIPVMQKLLGLPLKEDKYGKNPAVWLYGNYNDECLGVLLRCGRGRIFILPEFKSNDETIKLFIRRVMPKVFNINPRQDLVSKFNSPTENSLEQKLGKVGQELGKLEERREIYLEKLNEARLQKEIVIKKDETAKQALQYLDTAYQQEDVALFFLYKVVERIEHKLGGEKKTKDILKINTERNYIGNVANASYGDVRHAPKPGEIIKPWTDDEIKKCFEYTEVIIERYFKTLF